MKKLILGLLQLLTVTVSAQITSATLTGSVQVEGEVRSKITLVLIDKSTNYFYTTDVNKKGNFEFTDLQVGGPYELQITINDEKFIRKYSYFKLGENEVPKIIVSLKKRNHE